MQKKPFYAFGFIVSLITFSFLSFGAMILVSAQADPNQVNASSIGISPANTNTENPLSKSWFIEKLQPGVEVDREFVVYNYSELEQKIGLNSNDATQTQDGNFTYKQNYEQSSLVGKWVTLADKEVVVPPQSQKTIKFKLKIPADISPGEYAGVISAQLPGVKNTEGVTIESRVGTRLYITVGEDLKLATKASKFSFFTEKSEEFKLLPNEKNTAMLFTLQNTGNVYSKVYAEIRVITPSQELIKIYDKDLSPSGQTISDIINLDKPWEVGNYKASVKISTNPNIALNKSGLTDSSLENTFSTEFEMTTQKLEAITLADAKLKASAVQSSSKFEVTEPNKQQLQNTDPKVDFSNLQKPIVLSLAFILLFLIGLVSYLFFRKKHK